MKKPIDYDTAETKSYGSFDNPPDGYYEWEILGVNEQISKAGNSMLVFQLDICEGEYTGLFQKFPKKYFQNLGAASTSFLKGVFKALEESNNGFKVEFDQFDYFDIKLFIGKKVGGKLRKKPDDEYPKIEHLCSIKTAKEKSSLQKMNHVASNKETINRPKVTDADIPF